MNAGPLLEAKRLSVGYRRRGRRRAVLSGLDLAVAPGELVCVLGPNGIGKSTMLRTLAGLQRPLAGTLTVAGAELDSLAAFDRARLIGVVLPERIWVGALRARQMVALGRYAHCGWNGRLTPRDHAIVDGAIDAVGAMHLAERDCRELSDGERQKLNLARVLAQEPAIIVLDEPTAFLDVAARVDLMALLRRLTRDTGVAVVASTHDLDLAIRNADTAWLIGADRNLHSGAPEDLLASGALERTFSSDHLHFEAARFGFRSDDRDWRTAFIAGPPQGVRLAAITLERERFRLAGEPAGAALTVEIVDDSGRWRARHDGPDLTGTSFAALAAFARRVHAAADQSPSAATAGHKQSTGR